MLSGQVGFVFPNNGNYNNYHVAWDQQRLPGSSRSSPTQSTFASKLKNLVKNRSFRTNSDDEDQEKPDNDQEDEPSNDQEDMSSNDEKSLLKDKDDPSKPRQSKTKAVVAAVGTMISRMSRVFSRENVIPR